MTPEEREEVEAKGLPDFIQQIEKSRKNVAEWPPEMRDVMRFASARMPTTGERASMKLSWTRVVRDTVLNLAENTRLAALADQNALDAARYRLLRDASFEELNDWGIFISMKGGDLPDPGELDALLDAARVNAAMQAEGDGDE